MSQTKVKSGLLNFPDQTDFVKLPSGTTAQRPSSPEKGYSRYNTTDNKLEFWNGTVWQQLPGVVAPIITSISYPGDDLAADPAGGQTITINGSDFKAGATVTVDGTTPSVITFVSATEITFTAPAKTAGDYDIVVTNVDGGNATAVDGMTYNGLPSWTTPAGNLGTFAAGSTIPTITLVATEPDSGVVSYSVTTGALPTGLALTGADIDGTVPSPAGQTTYNFSVTASDDENQSTERAFNMVVYLQVTNTVSEVDPFGDSSGFALYRLENNANDEGGVYNGTWSGTPAYTTGVFGQAANFVGGSTYINTNIDNELQTSVFSYSLWFNASVIDSTPRHLIARYSASGPAAAFWSRVENGKIVIGSYGSSGFFNVEIPGINANTWYNIVAVYNGSDIKYYLNGENTGTIASGSASPVNITTASIILGQINGYIGTYAFNGSIDQVRIFNTALTPLEVESLYQERTVLCGGQADTLDILGDNSCIATYQLNGNANDLSGNYSGTATGVSYGVGEFDLAGVFNTGAIITTNLNTGPQDVNTYSFWFKSSNTQSGGYMYFLYKNTSGVTYNIRRIYAVVDSQDIIIDAWGGSGNSLIVPFNWNDNNWHHLVVTFNYPQRDVYIDGSLAASQSTAEGTGTVYGNINFGNIPGNTTATLAYPHEIDQVRIFNKALNSTEVTTLYNETACDALACGGTTNTLDILSDGSCIAAYPLDGSPADLSGNYNGVQSGGLTYPQGEFDLAGSFWLNQITLPQGTMPSGNNERSVSAWIKTTYYASPYQQILAYGGDGTNLGFYFRTGSLGSPKLGIAFYANDFDVDASATNLFNGEWHHVVCTVGTTIARLYVDGNQLGGDHSKGTINTTNTEVKIGSTNSLISFKGEIDQVRIFNKALSAGEVTTLYNETACN